MPRQFLDLGPSTTVPETDEVSNSSSEDRTRPATPQNNIINEIVPCEGNKRCVREESPESESQGLGVHNKVPKLINTITSKPIDVQSTDATMRKARVSVRARSESPMVCLIILIHKLIF